MLRDGGRIRLRPRSFRNLENDRRASSDSGDRQSPARRDYRRRWVLVPLADSSFLSVARADASGGSAEPAGRLTSSGCAKFASLRKQKCDLESLSRSNRSTALIFPSWCAPQIDAATPT